MFLLEFSMAPLTQGESVSAYVARSLTRENVRRCRPARQ